ncbi:acetoacetate decarboxylase family protein [Streptomyces stramineus]
MTRPGGTHERVTGARRRTASLFPGEPWHLRGALCVSLWRIRPRDLPRWPLPHRARPLVTAGRATLLTFWADYRPPGVLAYRELLLLLVVRRRGRVRGTVVAAWVDNERSRTGGRALWGIPKHSGEVCFETARLSLRPTAAPVTRACLTVEGAVAARGAWREVIPLPGRRPCARDSSSSAPPGPGTCPSG